MKRIARLSRRAPLPAVLVVAAALASSAGASHTILELVSAGSQGGNGPHPAAVVGASKDGTRVFFETAESLTSTDGDSSVDVYQRLGTTTTQLSTAPGGGNGAVDAHFAGASDDGTRVFFETAESLVGSDTDSSVDVYQRSGSATTQISSGSGGGNGAFPAHFEAASSDGTRVLFETDERLAGNDTDAVTDVYQRIGSATSLLSTGPNGGNGPFPAYFDTVSTDGNRMVFETDEQLVNDDDDSVRDVYERSGGNTTTLLSTGPGQDGPFKSSFVGASKTADRVFFRTAEPLLNGDGDSAQDVYERASGNTALLSTGPDGGDGAFEAYFAGASASGTHVFLETAEPLVAADNDISVDVYERSGGSTTLVSTGPTVTGNELDAAFQAVSDDGTRVFFDTDEQLVGSDTDLFIDLYERSGGVTTLVSTGPDGGNGAFDADYAAIASSGGRIFFSTTESLLEQDADGSRDIYERYGTRTSLISIGPGGGNAEVAAFFAAASQDGGRIVLETDESLLAADTDAVQDIYANNVPTGYPRPQGGAQIRVPLALAYLECLSPNRSHGPGLSHPSCNPGLQESTSLTIGTSDTNGFASQFGGSARVTVCPNGTTVAGACSTPAGMTAPDVKLEFRLTDVRCLVGQPVLGPCEGGSLSDYTGDVLARLGLRITDRHNSVTPGETGDAATVADLPFTVPTPCNPNPAGINPSSIGATCSISTTANTVLSGALQATKRGNWELAPIEVLDGGADGDVSTEDNMVFVRQGLFVP